MAVRQTTTFMAIMVASLRPDRGVRSRGRVTAKGRDRRRDNGWITAMDRARRNGRTQAMAKSMVSGRSTDTATGRVSSKSRPSRFGRRRRRGVRDIIRIGGSRGVCVFFALFVFRCGLRGRGPNDLWWERMKRMGSSFPEPGGILGVVYVHCIVNCE